MSAAFSGVNGELGNEFHRGIMAYLDHVNESGGIHGRSIRVVSLDDGYDPDACFRNTVSFLRESPPFALFAYTGTPTSTRILPLLHKFKEKEMFLLFPMSGAQPFREPPYGRYVYNLRASYFEETRGLVEHLVAVGRKRIAVFYQGDVFGRCGWDGVRRALARHGLDTVAEAAYDRDAAPEKDFGPEVELLRRGNPDAVVCIGTTIPCSAFIVSARQGGLTAPVALLSSVSTEKMLDRLGREEQRLGIPLSRDIIQSQVVPSYEDLSLPGVRLYRELMDRYREGGGRDYSFQSLEGFLNSRLLCEIVRRMGPEASRDELPQVMESITGLDLGIGEPVRFGHDRRQGLDAVYYTTLENGRHHAVRDWERWRK
ncbi:ABC transporter substrate-binding protein [Salidesulfovibrio onnuriiensis]|uniref:ABC transporter substrate-binding protein n=1 Tax=Salidesulfovibrio onnuriiensis TaxID=2583823 RepID=UPI00164F7651|nr:ABC transporter substrate-binding protein [Salidesulfovibrio onnuriiensis]